MSEATELVEDALFLVQDTILGIEEALRNGPTPSDAGKLMGKLSDLQLVEFELKARLAQLQNDENAFPPPTPGAHDAVAALLAKVSKATSDGASAVAWIGVASQVASLAMTLTS
jgi:hypothetical protein